MARSVQTAIDSLDFFVQSRDVTLLTVTATATSNQNGADQTNTFHKGAIINPVFTTIAATCTVRLTVQGKDSIGLQYYTIASLSLDGITTGNIASLSNTNMIKIYPGIGTAPATGTGVNDILPAVFRVIASISATASAGGAATSFKVNASKII